MPQSRFSSPLAIVRRSFSSLATSGCTVKPSGTVVMRSPMRLSSASGTAVSAWSVHLAPRNGDQSIAYLLL
ncbi:hypothetical protein D3C78_1367120 [compost metagenome]